MHLSEFAEQLLFGETLADKLVRPGPFRDDVKRPALRKAPVSPGRPSTLTFGGDTRDPFPKESELVSPTARGLALHAFANHELLAIELMALAILRFPDADPEFRLDLFRTIAEEQRHLRHYIRRMGELGVSFGDTTVNGWFWSILSDMKAPVDFSARMGLTLEQANLDFAWHYAQLFKRLGDYVTADLLDVVYRDEIRHVALGAKWFLADSQATPENMFQEWASRLPSPLTPARAKGIGFQVPARRQALLPEAYINKLAVFQHSKGRPPSLWIPNMDVEQNICGLTAPSSVNQATEDLGPLLLFLAKTDDIVVTPRPPSTRFLSSLLAAGFHIPRVVESLEASPKRVTSLKPWGWTDDIARLPFSATDEPKRPPTSRYTKEADLTLRQHLRSAAPGSWTARWVPSWTTGRWVQGPAELASYAAEVAQHHPVREAGRLRLKVPLGTAGRGHWSLQISQVQTLSRGVEKALKTHGGLVVEPELERLADLSVLLDAAKERPHLATSAPLVTPSGRYQGHVLGRRLERLPSQLKRALHEQQEHAPSLSKQLRWVAAEVASVLRQEGYHGLAGIDAMLCRVPGTEEILLQPLVELNPRRTMGHVALAIERHVAHAAVWLQVPVRTLTNAGFTAQSLASRLEQTAPIQTNGDGLLTAGALFTTDPTTAQQVSTLLLVGRTVDACCRLLPTSVAERLL